MFLKRYKFVIVALIVFLFTFLSSFTNIFLQLEAKLYDLFMQQRGHISTSEKVAIVAIDEETMRTLNMQWPLPRSLYIQLIENIQRAGGQVIVFDVQFPETAQISLLGQENQDLVSLVNQELERDDFDLGAISANSNVIHACKIEREGKNHFLLLPNKRIMQSKPKLGLVSNFTDIDNFLRKYQVMDTLNDQEIYSLALKAFSLYTNNQIQVNKKKKNITCGEQVLPYYLNYITPINYRGRAGTFSGDNTINPASTYYSFIDLIDLSSSLTSEELDFFSDFELDDELSQKLTDMGIDTEEVTKSNLEKLIEKQAFHNKIVLIGSTLKEHHDNFHTPFGIMPGVEVHANFLDSLLADDLIFYLNHYFFYISLLIFLIFTSYLFHKYNAYKSLIILIIILFIHYLLTLSLLKYSNLILPKLEFVMPLFIIYLYNLIEKYIQEAKAKREIKSAFQHYMAPELVNQLISDPKQLQYGGANKEISVLFSDIRSFTTYTESHPMEDTVAMLREYLTEMTKIVIENKGIIDKFVGDEIMALYGTPLQDDNHAYNACKTALVMRERLTQLQAKWAKEGKDIIEIGIGVNSGVAVVGNLGSEQVFDYTAIGDVINLGARLEASNKKYPSKNKIIISEFTLNLLKDKAKVEFICNEYVKGKNKGVDIYHLHELKK